MYNNRLQQTQPDVDIWGSKQVDVGQFLIAGSCAADVHSAVLSCQTFSKSSAPCWTHPGSGDMEKHIGCIFIVRIALFFNRVEFRGCCWSCSRDFRGQRGPHQTFRLRPVTPNITLFYPWMGRQSIARGGPISAFVGFGALLKGARAPGHPVCPHRGLDRASQPGLPTDRATVSDEYV